MANDLHDREQREARERSRYDDQRGDRHGRGGGGERGFLERAGDEISSWFGDDEAERRRGMDERSGGGMGQGRDEYRRDEARRDESRRHYGSNDRSAERRPDRDQGPYRPYTGRLPERSEMSRDMTRRGPDFDREHGSSYRPMTGDYGRAASERFDREQPPMSRTGASSGATAAHDRHYSEWRQRQIDEIDRDYDDYRREHQSMFESDFSNWRSARQAKRQMLGSIREHMPVFGSDDQPVGTVDKVRGDRVILTKNDSPDGQHHSFNSAIVDRVEGDRVILDRKAEEARATFGSEERDRSLNDSDNQSEAGPHILNRSFSGTY